jgi:hypothetical protein
MKFQDTKIYQEIITTDKTLPVPFYTKTGITINENNMDYIIEVEIVRAKQKIQEINDKAFILENIESKIIDQYRNSLNKPYLILEFAYFNKGNVEEGIKVIENSDNFYQWLVE